MISNTLRACVRLLLLDAILLLCEHCKSIYPGDEFRSAVRKYIKDVYQMDDAAPKESTRIECLECKNPTVKPATVLYGRNLPEAFHQCLDEDFDEKGEKEGEEATEVICLS